MRAGTTSLIGGNVVDESGNSCPQERDVVDDSLKVMSRFRIYCQEWQKYCLQRGYLNVKTMSLICLVNDVVPSLVIDIVPSLVNDAVPSLVIDVVPSLVNVVPSFVNDVVTSLD